MRRTNNSVRTCSQCPPLSNKSGQRIALRQWWRGFSLHATNTCMIWFSSNRTRRIAPRRITSLSFSYSSRRRAPSERFLLYIYSQSAKIDHLHGTVTYHRWTPASDRPGVARLARSAAAVAVILGAPANACNDYTWRCFCRRCHIDHIRPARRRCAPAAATQVAVADADRAHARQIGYIRCIISGAVYGH